MTKAEDGGDEVTTQQLSSAQQSFCRRHRAAASPFDFQRKKEGRRAGRRGRKKKVKWKAANIERMERKDERKEEQTKERRKESSSKGILLVHLPYEVLMKCLPTILCGPFSWNGSCLLMYCEEDLTHFYILTPPVISHTGERYTAFKCKFSF